MILKLLRNKKGFVSIETILACVVAMMVIFVGIGIFTYTAPRLMLQTEVHNLTEEAKIQGGLTDPSSMPVNSDIQRFKDRMSKIGYDPNKVTVTAVTTPGNLNAIGVSPLNSDGTNYIKRDSGELIQITVQVPANVSILAPLSFFHIGSDQVNSTYTIRESTLSERW